MDSINVEHLSKQFTEVKAVDDLSFSVAKGEVYGFLGQNGAGKSTTIRMLLTLIRPTAGRIFIMGKELQHNRKDILRRTGAIIEKPDLYKYLTALENIRIMARLSGVAVTGGELQRQLDRVGIGGRANSKVNTFSQGMKQRLGIACALVHNPDLIILDEPTNGLDPQGIADIRNLILQLSREEGKTVFVSSHLLNEIELIADSMLIIDKGKKVAEGKVAELLNPADTLVKIQTGNNKEAWKLMEQSQWQDYLLPLSDSVELRIHKQLIPDLVRFLVNHSVLIVSVQPKHSLENFFLSLTSSSQHVEAN